jgi:filamentous hemagglutinin family protein
MGAHYTIYMRVENLAFKAVTWVTLLSFFCGFVLTPAYANPEGGVVTGGSATITTDGTRTDIVQTTSKAVIDWRSFDIGAGEHTQFHQPGASSIALNRINDYKPSQIDGLLTANGKIILINPNGVFFGAGAVVDVNSMLATTTGIDNDSFMKHDTLHFNQVGNADASIINEGRITAADAGLIGFVAPQVENRGVITAKLGKVQLASGETYTVDLAGDGLINLAVSDNLQKQIVRNSGVISANGGEIHMTAAAARNQVDRLVENSGRLEARSFSQKGGKIVLMAQGTSVKKAQVLNKGTIDVSAIEDGAAGGKVEVLGDHVGLMENSKILASGLNANGGDVMVGGDYQGLGPTQRADITYVAPNALIDVRANGTGNGGRAIVWADDTMRYYGMIDGRGGDLAGNGGMAEVSGQSYLDFLGNVDLSALNGERGHLLLDPGNIIICQFGVTAGCNPSPTPALTAASNVFTSTATDSYVNIGNAATAGSLVALLQSADVTIATGGAGASAGNITVADAISWTAANTLTLNAHGQIIINAPITGNGLSLISDGDIAINAALTPNGSSTVLILAQKTASRTMGIGGGAGAINISVADIANINSGWGEVIFGTGSLTGKSTVGVAGVTLNLPFNARINSAATSAANYLTINGDIVMGGKNLTIAANGAILNGTLSTTGGGVFTGLARNGAQSICVAMTGCGANYTAAMLDRMGVASWTRLDFGTTGNDAPVWMGSYVWNNNVRLLAREDDVTVSGAVDMNGYNLDLIVSGQQQVVIAGTGSIVNANNMTLQGRLGTIINGNINGTGNLTITPYNTTGNWDIGGEVNAANVQITAASLDNIGADWNKLIFTGSTVKDINIGAYNWRHDVEFRRFVNNTTSFLGAQDFGGHDVTLTGVGNYAIGAAFSGTGNLTIQGDTAARAMAIGGAGGFSTLGMSTASIANIQSGFSNITLGRSDQTGNLIVSGTQTWKSPLFIKTLSGTITTAALTVSGGHDLTIETDSNYGILGALSGTGNLYLRTMSDGTPITLGGTGAGTNFTLNQTELNNITDGWAGITIGRETGTGTITAGSRGWNDNLTLQSNTGLITISGTQYMNGSNNLSILSNVGPVINASLESASGGVLTLRSLDSTLDIGLAGASGAYEITTANLNNITDGWGGIVIGGSNHTGAINANAYTNWKDPVSFVRNAANTANAINVFGNQAGTGNTSFAFAGNVNLGGNITTSNSTITFNNGLALTANSTLNSGSALTSLQGVTAGSYAFSLAGSGDTQLNGNITSTDAALDLSRTLTLANNVTLSSGTGVISLKAVNAGVHSLVFAGSGGLNLNGNITSTDVAIDFNRAITLLGNSTLDTGAADISLRRVAMGGYSLGISGSGGLNLYNDISSTNTLLNIGRDAALFGNVTLNTGTGDIYMKDMNMGVHSLAFIGSGGLYLSGDITSTDVALNINRDLVLDDNAHIDTGTADISLRNAILNDKSLTFGGTGNLNLRGSITSSDVDIDFNRNVFLDRDTHIDAGAGDIFAKNITAGGSSFTVGGSGMFYLDGDISADGDLYLDRDLVLTGNSRIASDGDLYFMSLYADNSNLTFGGSGQNIYLRGTDVISNGTDIDFRGRYVAVDNGGSGFIIDAGAGDLYFYIFDAGNSDLSIKSGGKLYVANTMGNSSVGFYANYGSLNIEREIITNIADPLVWLEVASKRAAIYLSDKITSDAAVSISASSDIYVGGDITSAGDLYVSADTVQLDGSVTAGSYTDIRGNTQLYLGKDVTATTGDIYLLNAKLTGNAVIGAMTGDIYLDGITDADIHNLTFAGAGDLYLNGDVRSTDTALDFNRDVYLTNNSYIDAGTADITVGNVNADYLDLRFGGSGLLNVNGTVSSSSNDLFFDRNIVLTGNSSFTSASGQVVFNGTVDGAYDMIVDTANDVTFVYPVGDATRLGHVTIANASNVYADSFKAASFTQSAGTGRTEFTNDGLNTTGDITINTEEIAGAYEGDEGMLNSGSGTITAETTFNTLDINGAGATLTAGAIGSGAVNQAMANRITVGGAAVTSPSGLFTFGGYQIGYVSIVVPPVTPPVTPPGQSPAGQLPATVVATISAPSIQLENGFSHTSANHTVAAACAAIQSDVIISDAFFGGSSASATASDDEDQDAHKANSISTSAGGIAATGCSA